MANLMANINISGSQITETSRENVKGGVNGGDKFLELLSGKKGGHLLSTNSNSSTEIKLSSIRPGSEDTLESKLFEYGALANLKLSYVAKPKVYAQKQDSQNILEAGSKAINKRVVNITEIKAYMEKITEFKVASVAFDKEVGKLELLLASQKNAVRRSSAIMVGSLPDRIKVSFMYSGNNLNIYIRDNFSEESYLNNLGEKLLSQYGSHNSKLIINGKEEG